MTAGLGEPSGSMPMRFRRACSRWRAPGAMQIERCARVPSTFTVDGRRREPWIIPRCRSRSRADGLGTVRAHDGPPARGISPSASSQEMRANALALRRRGQGPEEPVRELGVLEKWFTFTQSEPRV